MRGGVIPHTDQDQSQRERNSELGTSVPGQCPPTGMSVAASSQTGMSVLRGDVIFHRQECLCSPALLFTDRNVCAPGLAYPRTGLSVVPYRCERAASFSHRGCLFHFPLAGHAELGVRHSIQSFLWNLFPTCLALPERAIFDAV
jgi:hypothetical protein